MKIELLLVALAFLVLGVLIGFHICEKNTLIVHHKCEKVCK